MRLTVILGLSVVLLPAMAMAQATDSSMPTSYGDGSIATNAPLPGPEQLLNQAGQAQQPTSMIPSQQQLQAMAQNPGTVDPAQAAVLAAIASNNPEAAATLPAQITGGSGPMPAALQRRAIRQADLPQMADPWSPPGKAGGATAVYFQLRGGRDDDRLVGASSPWATTTGVHVSAVDKDGVARMTEVKDLPLPARGRIPFVPRSYYVMMTGLKRELRPGQFFPLILHFEKAGEVRVMVHVTAPAGSSAAAAPAADVPAHPGSHAASPTPPTGQPVQGIEEE